MPFCSSGFVGFNRVLHGDRWVHSGARWEALGSSRVVEFTRVRPGCCCVHPWSLGGLGCALGVVWVIRGRLVHSGAP